MAAKTGSDAKIETNGLILLQLNSSKSKHVFKLINIIDDVTAAIFVEKNKGTVTATILIQFSCYLVCE